MPSKYIIVVVGTTDNEKTWFVKFSDNPGKIVAIKKEKAMRYITKKTEYEVEKISAVYRMDNGPPLVRVWYTGFSQPEEDLASNFQDLIDLRRKKV